MNDLTITICQADLHWESIEANHSMFEEMIWQIEETPDLIILPEMFTTGFSMNAKVLSEPPGGKTYRWMQMIAAQTNAAVTGSYIVKDQKNYYNRLYFVYPNGTSLFYDKKHLFTLAGEEKVYSAGSKKLVLEYRGWRICPLICYDLRFPVWARSVSTVHQLYEYDLLLYVANWPDARVKAWDTLLQARAIENISFCAGVNRVGVDGFPKEYSGHSAVYDFKGEIIVKAQGSQAKTVILSAEALYNFRLKYAFKKDADGFDLK